MGEFAIQVVEVYLKRVLFHLRSARMESVRSIPAIRAAHSCDMRPCGYHWAAAARWQLPVKRTPRKHGNDQPTVVFVSWSDRALRGGSIARHTLETIESVPDVVSTPPTHPPEPVAVRRQVRFLSRRPWLDRKRRQKRRFRGAEFDWISESPEGLEGLTAGRRIALGARLLP